MSNTVSRVLYLTIIYLGLLLPAGSSNLPGTRRAAVSFLFGLASDGVYICHTCYQMRGELLPRLFTLTALPMPCKRALGSDKLYTNRRRLFSVALAWESPPPDVIRHPAL